MLHNWSLSLSASVCNNSLILADSMVLGVDDTLKLSVVGLSLDETDKDIIESFLDKTEEDEMYRGKYIFRKLSEC